MRPYDEFQFASADGVAGDLVTGPDGNVWSTQLNVNTGKSGVVAIAADGALRQIDISGPLNLETFNVVGNPGAFGKDHRFYFLTAPRPSLTIQPECLGSVDITSGTVSCTPLAFTAGTYSRIAFVQDFAFGLVLGPDNRLWSKTANNEIAAIDPATMAVSLYTLPSGNAANDPMGTYGPGHDDPQVPTVGADGNLWFAELGSSKIGRITTAGIITEFPIPAIGAAGATAQTLGARPAATVLGPDGNIWFSEANARAYGGYGIGKITPSGTIAQYPATSDGGTVEIIVGPDNNIWASGTGQVYRFTTAGKQIGTFNVPHSGLADPTSIGVGAGPYVWYVNAGSGYYGRIAMPPTTASVTRKQTELKSFVRR